MAQRTKRTHRARDIEQQVVVKTKNITQAKDVGTCENRSTDLRSQDGVSAILIDRLPSSTAREMGLSSRAMLETLSSRLVTHFQVQVSPRLRWIDHENPWRRLLLPHSQSSSFLHLAILSLSAAHLSVSSATDSHHDQAFWRICQALSQQSLKSLTTQVCRLVQDSGPHESSEHASTTQILATMVVLCHVEMLLPESQGWKTHLQAFRIAWDRNWLLRNSSMPNDQLSLFLKKATADIEVFVIPSSLSDSQSPQTPLTRLTFSDRAWTFTMFYREVTIFEQYLHHRREQGLFDAAVEMSDWRCKVEAAYSIALSSTAVLWIDHHPTRAVFSRVVSAHYQAGLIYSYQALVPRDEADSTINNALDMLFVQLESIIASPVRGFDHDIFWPLFVAGTECGRSTRRQASVEKMFHSLIASTGFWCNDRGLRFLQLFWFDPEKYSSDNWIQYARNNRSKFVPFLIY